MKALIHKLKTRILKIHWLLILILAIALGLRIMHLDWDQGQYLHPDERFLVMVTTAMKTSPTWSEYVDSQKSMMNPMNIGYAFFVYGTFPLVVTKFVAIALNKDFYGGLHIVGRALSALADTSIVLCIYLIIRRIRSIAADSGVRIPRNIAYWAAFLYGISVLPIQLSHFFATDTFANAAGMWGIAIVVYTWIQAKDLHHLHKHPRLVMGKIIVSVIVAGICMGIAIASKISSVYMLPVFACAVFVLVGTMSFQTRRYPLLAQRSALFVILGLILAVSTYLSVRIADPYYFANPSVFSFQIHPNFISNIEELKRLTNLEGWFPPAVQWIHKPKPWFALQNIAWFGMGMGMTATALYGLILMMKRWLLFRSEKKGIALSIAVWGMVMWGAGVLLYQSMQIAHTLRYFLELYPFFSVLAAIGLHGLLTSVETSHFRLWIKRAMQIGLIIGVSLWTVAFCRIYMVPHSRITASKWIWENIPSGSRVGLEHWDDPLPLQIQGSPSKIITGVEMPIFGQDTDEKWAQMNQKFNEIDYYIMTSNRGWGSVTTVPERYPRQTKFYSDLFAEKTQFTHVKTFSSFPSLCIPWTQTCYQFNDQWSEEAFTVYDHPMVMIFRNKNK
ncbi:MAG: hypothetical protein WCO78_03745 [Candidatus Roizmanbacteria bacterium]